MITAFFLSTFILSALAPEEFATGDDAFDYYLGELVSSEQGRGDPMNRLITQRLTEVFFETTDAKVIKKRIRAVQMLEKKYPEKRDRFDALSVRLENAFGEKLKSAKKKRMIYTASGAVAGALIAIPVGNIIGKQVSTLGSKALLISVPVGALAGAGAGYLLGSLLVMPDYTFEEGTLSQDLDLLREEVLQKMH